MIPPGQKPVQAKKKLVWLMGLTGLTLLMIALGGVTRLTGSGLSMVEWKLVGGIIPPLTHADWELLFSAYQQFPEFQKVNYLMNLSEFKKIFYFEYSHRMLGRLIGISTLLPMIYFGFRRALNLREVRSFGLLFLLVAVQGLLGWYMVQSGLTDRPTVSHYRLAAHFTLSLVFLGFATFLILPYLPLVTSQNLLNDGKRLSLKLRKITRPFFINLTIGLFLLQLFYGVLTAGLDGGLVSTTYPKMLGQWIPTQLFQTDALHLLVFENPYFTNFFHRHLGVVVAFLLLLLAVAITVSFKKDLRNVAITMGVLSLMQPVLGVLSLVYSLPLVIASLHQVVAVILFECLFFLKWRLDLLRAVQNQEAQTKLKSNLTPQNS